MAKRVWFSLAGLLMLGIVIGVLVLFGLMINETRFDRPDEGFDRLTDQVESLPGVSIESRARWVEAPTFSGPSSYVGLTVDEANLPTLLDTACTTEYPDVVTWSLRILTGGGNAVSVHGDTPSTTGEPGGSRCPDFGFDVVGLTGEVDGMVPGVDLQPSIWENGRFALVALEDEPAEALLPLVARADDLRDAAGLDPHRSVEINSPTLGLVIESDEHDRYLALLSDLIEEHGVTSYWAGTGGSAADGVEAIQITAPDREHVAIESRIRVSDLRVAELPVRFTAPSS